MIEQRNQIIMFMQGLPLIKRAMLLGDNSFQAGLDALDPDCPCFVRDNGIRECVFLGLKYRIAMA